MLSKINPTQTQGWQNLNEHFAEINDVHMKDLFASDPERFNRFHLQFKDILVDYSKNRITEEPFALLVELAQATGVKEAIAGMFRGQKINETETINLRMCASTFEIVYNANLVDMNLERRRYKFCTQIRTDYPDDNDIFKPLSG